MKLIVISCLCIALGTSFGWLLGIHAVPNQRRIREQEQFFQHVQDFNSGVDEFNSLTKKLSEEAAPYEGSTASIVLAALKSVDANNLEDARSRLSAIIANYYQHHSVDGDTNLIAKITAFATKDTTLSNSLYRK